MTAKTVGFAIADEDRSRLDALVQHFAGGNRSLFLREAMRTMEAQARAERLVSIQSRMHEQLGRVLDTDDVRALIRTVARA